MRQLTVDMFVSLDGFSAGADGGQYWTFPYFGPEFASYTQRILSEPQLIIMGRKTYEIMVQAWPTSPEPLAKPMNSLPKLVFSSTLKEPLSWNNAKLAKNPLIEEITTLKQQPGDPLRTIGSISVARQLMSANLVDRLRLIVFPHLLGESGKEPIFADYPETSLSLIKSTVLDSRLVVCEYQPKEHDTHQ